MSCLRAPKFRTPFIVNFVARVMKTNSAYREPFSVRNICTLVPRRVDVVVVSSPDFFFRFYRAITRLTLRARGTTSCTFPVCSSSLLFPYCLRRPRFALVPTCLSRSAPRRKGNDFRKRIRATEVHACSDRAAIGCARC